MSLEQDAFELNGGAIVSLFELVLTDGTLFRMSPKRSYVWRGDLYEDVPCHLTQVQKNAGGERSRPRFSVVNPGGMFTEAVQARHLEGARLTRRRILLQDLENDLEAAVSHTVRVSRIVTMNKEMIVAECRHPLDMAAFSLPHRSFRPPEFRYVRVR